MSSRRSLADPASVGSGPESETQVDPPSSFDGRSLSRRSGLGIEELRIARSVSCLVRRPVLSASATQALAATIRLALGTTIPLASIAPAADRERRATCLAVPRSKLHPQRAGANWTPDRE